MDAHAISQTVQALNPLESAATFRALVLAWCGVVAVVLVAARPLLLDAVDLLWTVKRSWMTHGNDQGKDGTP